MEEGTIDTQQISTFANSDLSGQYALVMDGNTQGTLLTRIGTFIPDGNGNITLNEEANSLSALPGIINDVSLTGTYAMSGNWARECIDQYALEQPGVLYGLVGTGVCPAERPEHGDFGTDLGAEFAVGLDVANKKSLSAFWLGFYFLYSPRTGMPALHLDYRWAMAGSWAALKDAKRLLISSQFTTFHQACRYSGRRLLYLR